MAVQSTPFNAHIIKIRALLSFAQSKNIPEIEWKTLWTRIHCSAQELQSAPSHISSKQLQDLTLSLDNLRTAVPSQQDFVPQLKIALDQINQIYQLNNSVAEQNPVLPKSPPPMLDEFEERRAAYMEEVTYEHAESVLNFYPLTLKYFIQAFRDIKSGLCGGPAQKMLEDPESPLLEQQNVLKILLFYVLKKKLSDFEKIELFNINPYITNLNNERNKQYNGFVIDILEKKVSHEDFNQWFEKSNKVLETARKGEEAIREIKMKLALHTISLEDLINGKDAPLQPTLNTAVAVLQLAFPREGFYGLFHAQRFLSAPCLDSINVLNSLDLIDEAIELADQIPLEQSGPWQDVACKLMQKCTSRKKLDGGQKLACKVLGLSTDPILLGQISWFYYSSGKFEEAFHALIKTYRYLPKDSSTRSAHDEYLATLLHAYLMKYKVGPALDQILQLVRQIEDEEIRDLLDFRQCSDYGAHLVKAVHNLSKLRAENQSLLLLWPQLQKQIAPDAPIEMTPIQIRKWFREHQEALLQVKSLSLTGQQLFLPHQIGLLKELTYLKLEGFHLDTLPAWIPTLPNIEELILQHCGLQFLPKIDIEKHFLHLKKIDLRNNPLFVSALPVSICQWGGRPSLAALYVLYDSPENPSAEMVSAILQKFSSEDVKLFETNFSKIGAKQQALFKTAEDKLSSLSSTQFNELVKLLSFLKEQDQNLKISGDLVVSTEWLSSDPINLMMAIDLIQNDVVIFK